MSEFIYFFIGLRIGQVITNPFTKLSDVPPDFIAIKFFASFIRTCSSPPSSTLAFLSERENRRAQKFEAKPEIETATFFLPLVFSAVCFLGVTNFKEIINSPLYWAKAEGGTTEAACLKRQKKKKKVNLYTCQCTNMETQTCKYIRQHL